VFAGTGMISISPEHSANFYIFQCYYILRLSLTANGWQLKAAVQAAASSYLCQLYQERSFWLFTNS
jgi:hypothetical protein